MLLHSVCLARHVRMLPRHDHCNNRETHHTGKAKFRQALAESKTHMLCLSIEMVPAVCVRLWHRDDDSTQTSGYIWSYNISTSVDTAMWLCVESLQLVLCAGQHEIYAITFLELPVIIISRASERVGGQTWNDSLVCVCVCVCVGRPLVFGCNTNSASVVCQLIATKNTH